MWSFMTGFISLAIYPVFKVHPLVLSDSVTLLWTAARQAPRCVGFSRREPLAGCYFLLLRYVCAPLLFIHSVGGHLDSSSLALMNSASVDICLQVFLWTQIFVYPECVPRSEISGSYSNFC